MSALYGTGETNLIPMIYNRENAGAAALEIAERVLTGKPYIYGGTWPESGGTDCDGAFVWGWAQVGVTLQRPTETTYREYPCDDRSLPNEVGDGLFIPGAPIDPNPGHVMMYAKPGWVFEAEETGTLIGLKPFDTDSWEFRDRPSLALPVPSPTAAELATKQLKPIVQDAVAAAVKEGWNIFTWDWKKNVFIKAVPSASGQRYVSIFYPKGK